MPRNAVPQVGATWPQIGVGVGVDVGVGVVVEQHRQRRRRRWQRRQQRRRRSRCCRFRCPSSTITVGKQFPDLPHQQRECAAFKRETSTSCVPLPARSYGRRNWLNCRNGKPQMCDIGRQLHTLFPPLSLPSVLLHLSPLLQLSLCSMSSAGRGNCALFAQLNATYVMHSMEPIPRPPLPLAITQSAALCCPPSSSLVAYAVF